MPAYHRSQALDKKRVTWYGLATFFFSQKGAATSWLVLGFSLFATVSWTASRVMGKVALRYFTEWQYYFFEQHHRGACCRGTSRSGPALFR